LKDIPKGVPEEEWDALYGLPLEEFTKARNKLAAELRAAGDREASKWVGASGKPTAAAWAVNQLMRTQRKDARELLDAGERLRKAHADVAARKASANDLREAAEAERSAIGRLSAAARGLTDADGRGMSQSVLDRVAQTLHALSSEAETRSLAEAGRLLRERQASGAGALAMPVAARRGSAGRRGPSAAQVKKARERLERAQKEARELRAARTRAAKATSGAERELARSRKALREADRRAEAKESEVEDLRRRLDELR
jgi:DNA repair exonuclease SbcCD ATPase subunit